MAGYFDLRLRSTSSLRLPEWQQLVLEEIELMRGVLDAEARIIVIDDELDRLCNAIASTLLAEHGNDRKSADYQRYFGSTRPSDLRRPVLGEQLETMRTWSPSLTTSGSQAQSDYGQQLADRVVEADQTPLTRPELKLPRTFANRFFLRSSGSRKPTIADTERTVLRLRNRLKRQEGLLEELLEEREREQRIQDDAELEAAAKALAEAEKAQAEAEARMDEIRARALGAPDAGDDEAPSDGGTEGDGGPSA